MTQNKIPYLTLIAGQQGGIGYPPIIVRLKGRWYAVEGSRRQRPPDKLENILWYQRLLKPYNRPRDPYWHTQSFVWKRWHNAPRLTWDKIVEMVKDEQANGDKGI
jgi:hypothetical protein